MMATSATLPANMCPQAQEPAGGEVLAIEGWIGGKATRFFYIEKPGQEKSPIRLLYVPYGGGLSRTTPARCRPYGTGR